jgi:O-antigen biosynthesis protein WbqP
MSFVGPRPALFNQEDLIQLREQRGINTLVPGLTGWAQINGRDELSINDKVELESEYFKKQSLLFDIVIIAKTTINALKSKEISH